MLNIENGKNITLTNLVSFRKKMPQEEINIEIEKLGNFLESKGINRNGPMITRTLGIEIIDNKYNVDMELMIPVDKKTELPQDYEMKDVFQLTDAVYVRHQGNLSNLQDTYNQAIAYMQSNNRIVKSAYNFYINDNDNMDNMIIDVYFIS